MPDLEAEKRAAALTAVAELDDGMLVGLGTGSTAAYAVREIGRRVRSGLRVTAVATSTRTEELARSVGITVVPFETVSRVDWTIDGADELDPSLRAVKGGGGALLREKVVATASTRMVVIVDSSKPVERLGRFRLPIEALPFAAAWVAESLVRLGARPEQRRRSDRTPVLTDQGNLLFDAAFGLISDPEELAAELDAIPGILEHGLFLSEVDAAYVGRVAGVEVINR